MRRSALVCFLAIAVVAVLVVATSVSASLLRPGVWVNGDALDLATGEAPQGAHSGLLLYVIAPIDVNHPQHPLADAELHSFGIHDHVFAMPVGRQSFVGACDQVLVVPGPRANVGTSVKARKTDTPVGTKPLLYEASVGNALRKLTSVARIKRAQALGLARLIHTNLMACTITPHR